MSPLVGSVALLVATVLGLRVGVLGVAALVQSMTVDLAVIPGLAWPAVLTAAVTVLLATGRRVTRLESALLIALTAAYWLVNAVG
ncbi:MULTISPECIES: hypothetical protein [Natrialbaceae]|uniref:hypothetical protein n=1 Tax=Natrialbaceae TaxID=1644061 RepID=UPI00207C4E4D|nr:hypothetical protein [Natronococcus sp. CG52]